MMKCFVDEEIEGRQRTIAEEHGFEVAEYSLYTYVNCRDDACPNKQ